MNIYQLVYRNNDDELRHDNVEGDTALIDSMSILDRNNVCYDAYEVKSNGNMVDIQEVQPLANRGWIS